MITFAPAKLAGCPYERLDQALICLQWGKRSVQGQQRLLKHSGCMAGPGFVIQLKPAQYAAALLWRCGALQGCRA